LQKIFQKKKKHFFKKCSLNERGGGSASKDADDEKWVRVQNLLEINL